MSKKCKIKPFCTFRRTEKTDCPTPQGDAKSIIKTHGKHKKVVLRKKNAPPKVTSAIRFASTCFSIGYKN